MKIHPSIRALSVVSIVSYLVISCGGGGGGTPADSAGSGAINYTNTTQYAVFSPHSWVTGANYAFNFSGSDTLGYTYTGQISWTKRNDTTYNSASASQVDMFLQLSDNTGASITTNTSSYRNLLTGLAIAIVNNGSSTVCTPTNPSQDIPGTVVDGDFGNSLAYTCSDGSSSTGTWQANLDPVTNNMKLTLSTTSRDQFGTLQYTEDDTIYVDTMGIPHRIDMRLTLYQNGVSQGTISLSSN